MEVILQKNEHLRKAITKGIGEDISFLVKQSVWRTMQFVEWTLPQENLDGLRTKYSNEDGSFWLGSYGIPILYIQAIQDGWPMSQPVCMPAWDFCF